MKWFASVMVVLSMVMVMSVTSYSKEVNEEEFQQFKNFVYQLGMFSLIEMKFQYKLVGVLIGYNCIDNGITSSDQCKRSETATGYINTLKNGSSSEISEHLGFADSLKWMSTIQTLHNYGLDNFLRDEKFKSIGEVPDSITFAYGCKNKGYSESECVDIIEREMEIDMIERATKSGKSNSEGGRKS